MTVLNHMYKHNCTYSILKRLVHGNIKDERRWGLEYSYHCSLNNNNNKINFTITYEYCNVYNLNDIKLSCFHLYIFM